METGLERIAEKARKDSKVRFTSLAHHLTADLIEKHLKKIPLTSAHGIDKESVTEARQGAKVWIKEIIDTVHNKGYRPPPAKRVYIPKPGKSKLRPIAMPTIRDKALQGATAEILGKIYENDFMKFSYGGRPGKSAHMALAMLSQTIANKKVSFVLEADIKNFFGSLNHEWLERFVSHRVGDPRILKLITRWLRAGVMEGDTWMESNAGIPQGGPISVVLSNLYLHYVLDLWFDKIVKPRLKGEAYLCRYLDDFVVCFQFKSDATRFRRVLNLRLAKFSLKLEPSKTRLVPFGKFAKRDSKLFGFRKPPTLTFLGFILYGVRYPWGYYGVGLRPEKSRVRRFLTQLIDFMKRNRHNPLKEQVAGINSKLRGFANYFGMPMCSKLLRFIHWWTVKNWRKALSRRSQSGRLNWNKYNTILKHHPILYPKLKFHYAEFQAFGVQQMIN